MAKRRPAETQQMLLDAALGEFAVDFHAILTPVFHPILTPPVGV